MKKRIQFNDPLYNIFYPKIRDRVRLEIKYKTFEKISKRLTGELNSQFWGQIGYQIGKYIEDRSSSEKA